MPEPQYRSHVLCCRGTSCTAGGSSDMLERFREQVRRWGLEDEVLVSFTGCHGLCSIGPIVVIYPEDILYCQVEPEDVPEIVEETLVGGNLVERLLYREPRTGMPIPHYHRIPFYGRQQRVILRNCGLINPERIEEYFARDGYRGLARALQGMSPDEVIGEVKESGLRGRGGGGFPTSKKWEFTRRAEGRPKYVVCNADEGDPGAFMDRSLIEGDPHSLLEGMCIAGYAIGAGRGFVYCRAEYPLAIKRLQIAIDQAREYGLLGSDILGSGFAFDIEIKEGAGAFVCGEETALMASIEGRRGEPRPRPPFPAQKGLWGQPTNINNVKSYAAVPQILSKGAGWFADMGTENSKGTAVFALTGKVNNTGLLEIPMGTTLGEIIFEIGNGIAKDRKFKAVQTGGPLGGCLAAESLNLPVDFDSLMEAGALMGSGGMIVVDEVTCMVELAKFFLQFALAESCGQCPPCRVGGQKMLEILERITRGEGRMEDLDMLEDLAHTMQKGSLCALGQGTPNPVVATLRFFREEYEAHILDRRCPAGACKALAPSPCQSGCPAEVQVPIYVANIAEGNLQEALRVHRESNPFVSVCGRVCPAFCEDKCRRGELDEPVAIRDLKRYMADHESGRWRPRPLEPRKEESIAIVGGGPGGLTAALRLGQMGYATTIYEGREELGGMMRWGIPTYRLPRDVLDNEIQSILRIGTVKVCTGIKMGRDVLLEELQDRHNAVLLAFGAQGCRCMGIPGEELKGVMMGMEYLSMLNSGEDVSFVRGKRIAVVGGGNVAMDAARSLLRLGALEVHLLYRRERSDMPAIEEEVTATEDEGIHFHALTRRWRRRKLTAEEERVRFHYLTAPVSIEGRNGHVHRVHCRRYCLHDESGCPQFDDSARKRPFAAAGEDFHLQVDLVVMAIGQHVEQPGLSEEGVRVKRDGTVDVEPRSFQTSREGVFSIGDCVLGPASVVEAVGHANRAARAIHRYLRGMPLPEPAHFLPRPEPRRFDMSEEDAERPRVRGSVLAPETRVHDFREVELGYPSEETAACEARRCLRCDLEEYE
ncbi:MAG: FAD-dependent oxidoreductase [Synergistales bacterium]|nr:FAD-dependent oxidoreductase [Synergistales bacterium]